MHDTNAVDGRIHLVPRLELECCEREMESGASATDGDRVPRPDDLLDPRLELLRNRSDASQRDSNTRAMAASSRSPTLGRWIGISSNESQARGSEADDDNGCSACSHGVASGDVKLVMTLRTRDQAEIVDALVAFHLNAGVDYVIATDHRSEDGTVDILEEYARAGVLHLIREHGEEVRGSEWRTRMARMAATRYAADWTFSCDGDEFWWPRGSSLKDVFAATPRDRGIVFGAVRNFVPVAGSETDFWERMTLRYSPHAPVNDPISPFRPYHPKVAHRADPTVVVHRGNHALLESRHLPVAGWYPIEVLHFPIRTLRQAQEKLLSWAQALGTQARGADIAAARAMRSGDVNTPVASYLLDESSVQRGLRAGVLVEDVRLRDALRSLLAPASEARRFELPDEEHERVRLFDGVERMSFERDLASDHDASLLRIRRRVDDLARRMSLLTPGVR